MEENIQAQSEEFEVLQSIYGDDIQLMRDHTSQDTNSHNLDLAEQQSSPSSDGNLISFRMKIPSLIEKQIIVSQPTDHLYRLFQTGLIVEVRFTSGYPTDDSPVIDIKSAGDVFIYCPPEMYEEHEEFKEMRQIAKEIQEKEMVELLEILNRKARESIGQVVMFILIQDIEDYLMEKFTNIGESFATELQNYKNKGNVKKVKQPNTQKTTLNNLDHSVLFYRKESKKGYYAFIDSFYSSLSFSKECVEKKKGMERIMVTASTLKSKVYTWGGIYKGALSNDMFEVSMEEGKNIIVKKTKQSSTCTPRLFHTFNAMNDGFVIIGGMTDPKTMSAEVCTARITSAGVEWQTAYKLANPICGHATCVRHIELYTFGGHNKSRFTNEFNSYRWCGGFTGFEKVNVSYNNPISPRAGASMAEQDGIIYIFGGHDEGQIFNSLHTFNIETGYFKDRTCQRNFIPKLTMATLLARDSNTLILYGGFDGTSWNTNMFEYDIKQNKWLIVPTMPEKNFDNAATAGSIQCLADSFVLFGGCENRSLSFSTYEAFLNRALFQKKSTTSEYSIRCFRSDKILKSDKPAVIIQSENYFKWFETTQQNDADLIFIFTPEEEESNLTDREKLPCCANKLVLQRFPEFKKMIMIAEQKKCGLDVNTSIIDNYELNHGDLIYLRINYVPEVKNLKKAFIRILQYIYSGLFDAADLSIEHFKDIYHLAVYYKLNLLVQSLLKETSLSLFLSQNFKTLERELTSFLKICPDGDVEDIEEFKMNLSQDLIPEVKHGLARVLALDHTHDPPIYRSIYAHKLLITISSRYFAATFSSNFFEAQKRTLIMDSVSVQSLLVILSFIYCPSYPLGLNSGNAAEIYVVSHLLELPLLQDKARTAIKQFEFDEHTALHILEIANEFGDVALQDYCFYLLAKDYDRILLRDPQIFNELTPEQRVSIYKKHLTIKK